MLKEILEQFKYRKKFLAVEEELALRAGKIKELESVLKTITNKATPELVVEKIIRRGIDWYDYEDISDINHKRQYFHNAQSVLKNETFINEIKHLLADQVEFIARESRSHEETMNIRMTINAIDLIKERLESIYDPDKDKPSTNNLHSAI
jgi:hypothetical protein